MPRLCLLCGQRGALRRTKLRYCAACHERYIAGDQEYVDPPENHPFSRERRHRVERMRQRAALGLPIFEEVRPDLD
jgi:hypothetical protein